MLIGSGQMLTTKSTLHQDTLALLQEVFDLTNYGVEILSDDEWRTRKELIELCKQIAVEHNRKE